MGEIDIEVLMPLYRYTRKLEEEFNFGFNFKVDSGSKENMIFFFDEFDENNLAKYRKPEPSETWVDAKRLQAHPYCPDILDFNSKAIIEFEESQGPPRPGAKLAKKGHQDDGMDAHTAERDLWYKLAGFHVLKIFDYELVQVSKHKDFDFVWQEKIYRFLCNTHVDIMTERLKARLLTP